MVQIISTQDVAAYTITVTLDNDVFVFIFDYNERTDSWNLSIETSDNESLISGLKLVLETNLLELYADSRLPKGELICIDNTGSLDKIGRDDLISNIDLLYITKEERDQIIQS